MVKPGRKFWSSSVPNSSLKPARTNYPGPCPNVLIDSSGMEIPQSLNPGPMLCHPYNKKCFLRFLLCFSLCPFPLTLSLNTTEKSQTLFSLNLPFWYLYTLLRFLQAFSSPWWIVLILSASPHRLDTPGTFLVGLHWILFDMSLFFLERHGLDAVVQVQSLINSDFTFIVTKAKGGEHIWQKFQTFYH